MATKQAEAMLSKDKKIKSLQQIYQWLRNENDIDSQSKIVDLYDKAIEEEYIISFTGHFSAGKSSIINYILGIDVLPKSPIPTSANIVKVKSGDGVARVYYHDRITEEYAEPYDIDLIKEYCMDKDTIKQIEINTSEPILPNHATLMDTPGIDAADDADREMTESALHLIDELYYVMDYNHVQSEVNMLFLREMEAQKVPIHIIINQIDKHNEAEISFEAFKERVKQTFDQWKIKPKSIHYTSALDDRLAHNDLKELKATILNSLHKRHFNDDRFQFALAQIIKEHESFLETKFEEKADKVLGNVSDSTASEITHIQSELADLKGIEDQLKEKYDNEIQMTLKNAYLMPASLRDLAEQFLISQQKDFKVGGLFTAKKRTEEEKENRLSKFLNTLQETIDSTVVWKLREKFNEFIHEYHLQDNELTDRVQNFTVHYTEEDLFSFMKDGAMVNGNYVLNYTNEIASNIKQKFRQESRHLWKLFTHVIKVRNEERKKQLEESLTTLEVNDNVIEEREQFDLELQDKLSQLTTVYESQVDSQVESMIQNDIKQLYKTVSVDSKKAEEKVLSEQNHDKEEVTQDKQTATYHIESITELIDNVTSQLDEDESFNHLIRDLQDKKDKLTNRQLTIALFGAFSAGKSSFANAMLSNRVLPVSPNPTTAVINRIQPVDKDHDHGLVKLTFKKENDLFEDLLRITQDFEPKAHNLAELKNWIEVKHLQHDKRLNNMYQSYLKAILAGYDESRERLGSSITITLDEFEAFVTDESKACYLEIVDLYYDCPLTRKGITLVDTPGADSVNARHTNVSFDYIKEADAILYVTYYNHAVTSADRDFLMQLGRVKEAFELDKMFFIVNAADLAQSETDLELVLDYVEDQLVKLGIRQAKIFPLSSKNSLDEKLNNKPLNTMMQAFEAQFYQFIEQELPAITIEAALWDFERINSQLEQILHAARLPEDEKAAYRKRLDDKLTKYVSLIESEDTQTALTRINERIERQLHFVLERLYIRFHDMFQEYFNPTTITKSGRQAREQLEVNRNNLVHYVGYELLQEVRAVSIRLEAHINELLQEHHQSIQHQINLDDRQFYLGKFERVELKTPEYEEAFLQIDYNVFQEALKVFRNLKTFFQNNEREQMKELFYEALKPHAVNYLNENESIMKVHYNHAWETVVSKVFKGIESEIKANIDTQLQVVQDHIQIEELETKQAKIKQLVLNLTSK